MQDNIRLKIHEFFKLAERLLQLEVQEKLKTPLLSILWKLSLCQYHRNEYKRIIVETFSGELYSQIAEATSKIFHMVAGTEEGIEFKKKQFQAEAHIIAFAQSTHSLADIIANVIYISLDNLKHPPIAKNRIGIQAIAKKVESQKAAPGLSLSINGFRGSEEFCYLSAYVNTIKHRSLIDTRYSSSFNPGEECHGLRIDVFDYEIKDCQMKHWERKWVDEFINNDFEVLLNMIGGILDELSKELERNSFYK